MKRLLFSIGFVLLLCAPAFGQLTPSSDKVEFSVVQSQDKYLPGASFKLLFELIFEEGWHGQSNNPGKGLIPTVIKLEANDGISLGRIVYPKGKMEEFAFTDKAIPVYGGTTYIGMTAALAPSMKPGEYSIKAVLKVQTCNDSSCLMPSNIPITAPITIAANDEKVSALNKSIYKANGSLFAGSASVGEVDDGSDISEYLTSHGLLLTFFFIFLGGLALNLTPCVYPLIPVTVSYFGGKSEAKKGHLIIHAILYLLGMAAMYSALGLFAALTGNLFGGFLQHWAVILALAVILVGLALGMFGLYEIRVPSALQQISGKNRQGFFGTFMMGLTVGVIAAPCIGPFVVGLLAFVGERGDPLLGFTMFFALGVGLGLPFVFLAIFSGGISALPRSGTWMVWVKQVFGFILIGMAIYFLEPLIPKEWYLTTFGVFLLISGLFLGWISKVKGHGIGFKSVKWALGLALVIAGIYLVIPAKTDTGPHMAWKPATLAAMANAKSNKRPVIIDFTADWCLPCKELDHYTFSDSRVIALSGKFDNLVADVTKHGDPKMEDLKKQFNVFGVPTVIFLDTNGNEVKDLRFVGFVDADDFLDRMKRLLEIAG